MDNQKLNNSKYQLAKSLVEASILALREKTPNVKFNKNLLAEVEINKFFYEGDVVDRAMIVLRANGCEYYKKSGGCSMCSHFNGTDRQSNISTTNYINQWNGIHQQVFEETKQKFDFNDYPVVCVYNLGSLLNPKEISKEAVSYIFSSLNKYDGVKKVIIESRIEYITDKNLENITKVYKNGLVEVGIGVESTSDIIREICHHKKISKFNKMKQGVDMLHKYGMRALAYVNFKPIFLTESEAITDAIKTAVDCFRMGFDAVSIEPTSLQNFSLSNRMYELGLYRVPWLWSVREVVKGIYEELKESKLDIRIGGYFDEEVLSGSQGVGYERNEIFPHTTSSNCENCSKQFVECIKNFNKTYDLNELYNIEQCPHCYEIWKQTLNIRDCRDIPQRVFDCFIHDTNIFRFRQATEDDLGQLKVIYDNAIKDLLSKGIYIYWTEFYPYPAVEEDIKDKKYYVLEVNGTILGGVSFLDKTDGQNCFNWDTNDSFFISRFVVFNEFHHLGLAQMLLKKVVDFARTKNKNSVKLLVANNNIPAISLYKKFGFKKVNGQFVEIIEEPDMILTEYGYEYILSEKQNTIQGGKSDGEF